jgi:hypothetical protein
VAACAARIVVASLLGLALARAPAFAQDDDTRARARELAEKAQDQLLAGDPKGALDLARQAEAVHHAPTILLLIARSERALGQTVASIRTYDRIIGEQLAADARPEFKTAQELALRERNELYAKVGRVEIELVSPTSGVTVTVAGARVDGVGPHPVEPAREVVVVADAEGYEHLETRLTLNPGEGKRLRLQLAPVGASDTGTASAEFDALARTPVPTIVSFSLAGAFFIVGAATGGIALQKTSDLEERCIDKRCTRADRDTADDVRALADASTAMFAAGGVAACAGAFFLIVSQGGTRWNEARVTPLVGPGFLGLGGVY